MNTNIVKDSSKNDNASFFERSGSSPTEVSAFRKNAVLKEAKQYIKAGLSVIPIRNDGSKAPTVEWKKFQNKSAEGHELKDLFHSGLGIAIVGGKVSGNLEIIDFDDEELFESWDLEVNTGWPELVAQLPLVKTPEGYHVYYRCEEAVEGNVKLAEREQDGEVKTLIETRGEGGYVLAPPSPPECHPEGKGYELLKGDPTKIPILNANERKFLINHARYFNERVGPGIVRVDFDELKPVGSRPGDIFNEQFTLDDWHRLLEKHGWKELGERDGVERWQRPGKKRAGTSATLNIGGRNLFCVFSTNARPFEAMEFINSGKGIYTPFAAYALLEHDGDFKSAARELAQQGYTPAREYYPEVSDEGGGDRDEAQAISWREFSAQPFEEEEKILFELERSEVGLLVAATNIGKTTLALNLALTIAAGGEFLPVAPENTTPKRVLLIDGETRSPRLQRDIYRMMRDWSEPERDKVKDNLYIICDEELGGVPLNLSYEQHMKSVTRTARQHMPDLIIIDTLSALFTVSNENDNAEMVKRVMRPLAALAKETGAAVLVLHHLGKQSEDSLTSNRAYRGRGASAIGASARLVMLLQPDSHDRECVVLSCAKSKGEHFEDVVMRLDRNSRWFSVVSQLSKKNSSYEAVIEAVCAFGRAARRKEIAEALTGKLADSTVTRHLTEAVVRGDLKSPKHGWYEPAANTQMLTSIVDKQCEHLGLEN